MPSSVSPPPGSPPIPLNASNTVRPLPGAVHNLVLELCPQDPTLHDLPAHISLLSPSLCIKIYPLRNQHKVTTFCQTWTLSVQAGTYSGKRKGSKVQSLRCSWFNSILCLGTALGMACGASSAGAVLLLSCCPADENDASSEYLQTA